MEASTSPSELLPVHFKTERKRRASKIEQKEDVERSRMEDMQAVYQLCESKSELSSLWKKVQMETSNLEVWGTFVKCVEAIPNNIEALRQIFKKILQRWPYCYGYWCKWAAFEANAKFYEESIKVYEDGMVAFPNSVEIHLSFIQMMTSLAKKGVTSLPSMDKMLERALDACKGEWKSEPVWREVLSRYIAIGDIKGGVGVLTLVLRYPTACMEKKWEELEKLVREMDVKCTLGEDEVRRVKRKASNEKALHEMMDDDVKTVFLNEQKEVFVKNMRLVDVMRTYESKVKRDYFHSRPLEREQLENWMEYLDWASGNLTNSNMKRLFERCLVPTALYEDFWLKYTHWLEKMETSSREVGAVYKRALLIHCPQSVLLALAYSAHVELTDGFANALAVLENFDQANPGHLLIEARQLGILRRSESHLPPCDRQYAYVSKTYEAALRQRRPREELSYLAMKYARFLYKVKGEAGTAEKVLKAAIEEDKKNETLYLQLLDIAYNSSNRMAHVLDVLDECIDSPLPLSARIRFSQRKLDFLEEMADNVKLIQDHLIFHTRLLALDTLFLPKPISDSLY